jgi:ParB family transcriptional regulator, chromosome partitioning protein
MARKPLDARSLANEILAESAEDQTPALPKGSVLASRQKSMAKLGQNVEFEQHEWIEPSLCKPSPENSRVYDDLTYADCEELIESIKSEGRQRIPAIVRKTDDPDHPYEIVAGMRRHFAISWLRANHFPEYRYLINVQELDDEAAFRLSDLENRARSDISDYERGQGYRAALEKHYGGSISTMADRLNIASMTLRRYVDLTQLDQRIVAAFGGRRFVTTTIARDVKPLTGKGHEAEQRLLAEAEIVGSEQQARAEGRVERLATQEVLKRLRSAVEARKSSGSAVVAIEVAGEAGDTLFSYIRPNRRAGLVVKFPAKPIGSVDEIKDAVMKMLDDVFTARR